MSCQEWTAWMDEAVRSGAEPNVERLNHVLVCSECATRWAEMNALNHHLAAARHTARTVRRTSSGADALWAAAHPAQPQRGSQWWRMALATAAMFVAALALTTLHTPTPDMVAQVTSSADATVADLTGDETEYTAVPFAPPLAAGERLSVEVAEVTPAELATMGVDCDPVDTRETLLAEVVSGEDGQPRAVRVLGELDY